MSETTNKRVMVVDDHPIVRDGLREALSLSGEFEVVAKAGDGAEAVRVASELKPDVIIMDVMMPGMDGVEACREIIDLLPDTRVLMLTASTEEEAMVEAMAAGATGYLLKDSGREDLLAAVRDVAAGRWNIPTQTFRRALSVYRNRPEADALRGRNVLTSREQEILRLFASGKSYAQIAEVHGNSAPTVRNAVYRIQDKVGVATKQEMVVWAVRCGLLDGMDV